MIECGSWKGLVDQVWSYVDRISVPEYHTAVLVSELRRTLSRSYRSFVERCCVVGGDQGTIPPPEMLPWTDILVFCAQYRYFIYI